MRYTWWAVCGGALMVVIVTLSTVVVSTTAKTRVSVDTSATQHRYHGDGSSSQTSPVPGMRQELTVVLRGKEYPELIPKAFAYRQFLLASAPSDSRSPKEQDAVQQRIQWLGLSQEDAVAYETALREVRLHDEYTRIRAKRRALDGALAKGSRPAIAAVAALDQEQRELMTRAQAAVFRVLSSQGAQRLDYFVSHSVRRNIQILGGVRHGVAQPIVN